MFNVVNGPHRADPTSVKPRLELPLTQPPVHGLRIALSMDLGFFQVSDEVAKIHGEKESRIIKLDFYLGLDVANRTARPKWNPDSYRRIVQRTGN